MEDQILERHPVVLSSSYDHQAALRVLPYPSLLLTTYGG